jgi:hypothetical protein
MESHVDWERFIDERIRAGSSEILPEAIRLMGHVLVHRLMAEIGDEFEVSRILGLSIDKVRQLLEEPEVET